MMPEIMKIISHSSKLTLWKVYESVELIICLEVNKFFISFYTQEFNVIPTLLEEYLEF